MPHNCVVPLPAVSFNLRFLDLADRRATSAFVFVARARIGRSFCMYKLTTISYTAGQTAKRGNVDPITLVDRQQFSAIVPSVL